MQTNLPLLKFDEIDTLLANAAGDVSYYSQVYESDTIFGTKTTATVVNGQWTRKQYAYRYMEGVVEAERKLIPKPAAPIATGKRAEPYEGPFPRGKHSHRCLGCGESAVACYKSKCRLPQTMGVCGWCRGKYK